MVTLLLTQRDFLQKKGYGCAALYVLLSSIAILLITILFYRPLYLSYPEWLLQYRDKEQIYTLNSLLEDYAMSSAIDERHFAWRRFLMYIGLPVFVAGIVLLVLTALKVSS